MFSIGLQSFTACQLCVVSLYLCAGKQISTLMLLQFSMHCGTLEQSGRMGIDAVAIPKFQSG